jgi:hypothetical protein
MGLFQKRLLKLEPAAQPGQYAENSGVCCTSADAESAPVHRRDPKWDLEFAEPILERHADPTAETFDVESLAARLSAGRPRAKQGFVFWSWMIGAPLVGAFMIFCLMNGGAAWAPICLFALATASSMSKQATQLHRERTALRNAQLDNRWLGAVCEGLAWPDLHVRAVAELLAVQMLGRLKLGDGTRLTEEHLTCLYERITVRGARRNPELARSVLLALPYIGTERALPLVERLSARGRGDVRSAASASLALLERRIVGLRCSEQSDTRTRQTAAERYAAEREPDNLTEAQREEQALIAAQVDQEIQEYEAALKSAKRPEMRVAFLAASWVVIVPYFAVSTIVLLSQRNFAAGLLTAILAAFSSQLYRLTLTDKHKLLGRKLAKVEDVRWIGRLADTLDWPDHEIKQFAISALTRLLKRVKATDKVFQTAGQRANLHRMLTLANARQNPEFLKAILAALEQVGDETAVPYVEQLAKATPTSRAQREVCEAANLCLDWVKSRAELSRSSQTLLRASAPNVMSADTLLRAATVGSTHDSEQLLRADISGSR